MSKRVIILGGGFGGLAVAKALNDFVGEVVLIDRNNHHLFQPLLYQVATAGLSGSDIAQPLRMILSEQRNLQIVMGQVERIDLKEREVVLADSKWSYDYLVIAVGMTNNYFGHDEWRPHALGMKSLSEAAEIRNRLLASYEQAENSADKSRRHHLLTTVVIGGGATGVELAGAAIELAELGVHDFRRIERSESRVVLVEAGPRLLAAFDPKLSENARKVLQKMGVEVMLQTKVLDIQEGVVTVEHASVPDVVAKTRSEVISAHTVIWAAGVKADPLTTTLGVPLDRGGRVIVELDCSVPGYPNVFAIGDCMSLKDANGVQVPGLAQGAMQSGKHVAQIIMDGAHRPAFTYKDLGTMATIGRKAAVAQVGKIQMTGFLAWIGWLFLHLVLLVDLRSKAAVFVQWVSSYLRYRPGARIIYQRQAPKT